MTSYNHRFLGSTGVKYAGILETPDIREAYMLRHLCTTYVHVVLVGSLVQSIT